MKSIILLLTTIITFSGMTQDNPFQEGRCNITMKLHEKMEKENPEYVQNRIELEKFTKNYINNKNVHNEKIIIPVVVHIVHNGDAVGVDENISDAQITSQIEVLNEDFGGTNASFSKVLTEFEPIASKGSNIQFRLAQFDPNGNATTGIVRHNLNQETWDTKEDIDTIVKPTTIWSRDEYLNIWSIKFGGSISGLLGFAQFPGGNSTSDGIVIRPEAIGRAPENPYDTIGTLSNNPFNGGRTVVHEVGHWLNLFHTWGGGSCSSSDSVSDTPPQGYSYQGCLSGRLFSCGSSDAYMTFMSELHDSCMAMFTNGQVMRMEAALNSIRSSIKSSKGIISSISEEQSQLNLAIKLFPNPAVRQIILHSPGLEINNYTIINILGKEIIKSSSNKSEKQSIDISNMRIGTYVIKIDTEQGVVYKKFSVKR